MVSGLRINNIDMTVFNKLCAWLILPAAILTLTAAAPTPLKKLQVLVRQEGAVVFVKPDKMPCIQGAGKPMEYDWTMTTLSDSVFITFTVRADRPLAVDSLYFSWGEPQVSIGSSVSRIYAEPKGKYWNIRLRSGMTASEFESMLESASAPLIRVADYTYQHRTDKWPEYRQVYTLGREIINNNR